MQVVQVVQAGGVVGDQPPGLAPLGLPEPCRCGAHTLNMTSIATLLLAHNEHPETIPPPRVGSESRCPMSAEDAH